jgi:hypothetical protein
MAFADLRFGLLPATSETQGQGQTQSEFGLPSFEHAGVSGHPPLLENFPAGTDEPDEVRAMDLNMPGDTVGGDIKTIDSNSDDLFTLGSAGLDNMDVDYTLGGAGGAGGDVENSNFDELFYGEDADVNSGDQFSNVFFGL